MVLGRNHDQQAGEWRSHAFGIGIRASFQVPGLPADDPADSLPITHLDLLEQREIDEAWHPDSAERLVEETFDDELPDRTIDFDEELGYRLYARDFGLALINPNGDRVLCASPEGRRTGGWQRFLVGRVLPWAALLRGREVFPRQRGPGRRASDRDHRPSGGGKTSLALRLVLRGAGFITDDVLALEPAPDGINAHPGANIAAVRPAEKAQIDSDDWRRLGKVLGTSGKTYVEVNRQPKSLPLDAIYFLRPQKKGDMAIEGGVDARELLASTFILSVASPQRLAMLLDLCGEISSSVSLFRLPVDPDSGASVAADAVWEHASAGVGAID